MSDFYEHPNTDDLPESDFRKTITEDDFIPMIEKMKKGKWIYFDEHRYLPMEQEFQNYCNKWYSSKEIQKEGWRFNSKSSKWESIRALTLIKTDIDFSTFFN